MERIIGETEYNRQEDSREEANSRLIELLPAYKQNVLKLAHTISSLVGRASGDRKVFDLLSITQDEIDSCSALIDEAINAIAFHISAFQPEITSEKAILVRGSRLFPDGLNALLSNTIGEFIAYSLLRQWFWVNRLLDDAAYCAEEAEERVRRAKSLLNTAYPRNKRRMPGPILGI